MPAGATYDSIASHTLTNSTTSTVSFSGISGSYTDLVLIVQGGSVSTSNFSFSVRVNNDSGSNYGQVRMYGGGSGTGSSDANASLTSIAGLAMGRGNLRGWSRVDFFGYSQTTLMKTITMRQGGLDSSNTGWTTGMWRSTAAITSIQCGIEFSQNFLSGTTFSLYGITAA